MSVFVPNEVMKKEHAIRFAGNASKLARLLDITPQAVHQWGDDIPELQRLRLKEKKPRWFARLRREQAQNAHDSAQKPI